MRRERKSERERERERVCVCVFKAKLTNSPALKIGSSLRRLRNL